MRKDAIGAVLAGVCVHGPDGRLRLVNPAFYDLLGLPHGAFPARSTWQDNVATVLLHGTLGPGNPANEVHDLLQPGTGVAVHQRFQRQGGGLLELFREPLPGGCIVTTLIESPPGVPRRLPAAANLVQVRAAPGHAECEADRWATLWGATIDHLPHGVVVFDRDGRVAMANPAYHRLFVGAPLSVGEHHADITQRRAQAGEYGPGDPAVLMAERLELDTTASHRLRRRRPNGTVLAVDAAPLPDGGRLHVITDVTAEVTAQEASRRVAVDMRSMLTSIREGIILWNKDQAIVACNPVAETLLRTPPGFLRPGLSLIDLIRNADVRGAFGDAGESKVRTVALAMKDRTRSHGERIYIRDGLVLDIRSDPVAGGGFVTTYTDVTDASRAETELKDAKAAADAANAAKSQFLAAVSHELRTPLNQVLGFSESLLRMAHDAEKGRHPVGSPGLGAGGVAEHAEAVRAAGRQLLAMIDDILDVTRMEAGRFDLHPDRVMLPRLVQACMRHVADAAAAAEITLIVDLPPDLPALHADERRLRQALLHLLGNAIKFTEAPGSVRVTAGDAGDGLCLDVADSGIGIASADLQRIYEPFTQLDAGLARRYGGAGLGLYITRAIMSAHNGTLRIDSTPGAGTTASLVFPAARVVRPAHAMTHLPPSSPFEESP